MAGDDEEPVDVTVERPYLGYLALAPERELAPNTRYHLTLAVPDADPIGMEFPTAEGPLEEAPPAPSATLQAFRIVDFVPNTCSGADAGSCLAIPDDTWVHVRPLDAQGEPGEPHLAQGAHSPRNSSDANCLELRTRALNGVLSETTTLCVDTAPRYELREVLYAECTASGLADEAVAVPAPATLAPELAEGCSVSGAPRSARGFGWSLLAMVGFASLRRRIRRRPARSS